MKQLVCTLVACVLAFTTILPATTMSAAAADERSLFLYYTHTKETSRIIFKRNGRYVQDGLNQLNVFLRDWRRNEPAKMDPALFDILWEVYQEAGSSQPIHIVSAYRSPATNAMLASNSSGVADNSQHMKGKAIDFFIPGVPVSRLREIGFRKQGGGVGYYPTSGSPFVHLDTGSVRAWPRMTTAQLREIFPDGRTLHIPSNGQVLSQEGYRAAQIEWQKCHRVPCSGTSASGSTQTADATPRRTLADFFFGGGDDQQTQTASVQPAQQQPAPQRAPSAQAQPVQQVAAIEPPTPPVRPADMIAGTQVADGPRVPENIPFQVIDADAPPTQVAALDAASDMAAPTPPAMSRTLAEMRATTPSAYGPSSAGSLAIAALDTAPVPQPRPDFGPVVVASAFAAPNTTTADTSATSANALLRPGLAAAAAPADNAQTIETAATQTNYEVEDFADLFKGPILPVNGAPDSATANAMASINTRDGELFAPDLAHVSEMFLTTQSLSSEQFAFMTDPDNADFDPTPQPGNGNREFQFSRTASLGPDATGFGNSNTIWVRVQ